MGITEAEVIRQAIDRQVTSVRLNTRDLKAWRREKTFIAKRMAKGHVSGTRRWKREDTYPLRQAQDERWIEGLRARGLVVHVIDAQALKVYQGSEYQSP